MVKRQQRIDRLNKGVAMWITATSYRTDPPLPQHQQPFLKMVVKEYKERNLFLIMTS